ncbi:MAG TPA: hypothetical protein VF881_12200 [Polyangiaceae bacterium]
MTNRTKKLLTAASFALGGAGVVFVGYLSASPLAFTHPARELASYAAMSEPSRVVDLPTAVETQNSLVLPEVMISTVTSKPQRSHGRVAKLEPCSEWTDVGAMYITAGGATGVRSVRQLCSETVTVTGKPR